MGLGRAAYSSMGRNYRQGVRASQQTSFSDGWREFRADLAVDRLIDGRGTEKDAVAYLTFKKSRSRSMEKRVMLDRTIRMLRSPDTTFIATPRANDIRIDVVLRLSDSEAERLANEIAESTVVTVNRMSQEDQQLVREDERRRRRLAQHVADKVVEGAVRRSDRHPTSDQFDYLWMPVALQTLAAWAGDPISVTPSSEQGIWADARNSFMEGWNDVDRKQEEKRAARRAKRDARKATRTGNAHANPAEGPARHHQVGEIVNDHRWNGLQWERATSMNEGDIVNGYQLRYNANGWVWNELCA